MWLVSGEAMPSLRRTIERLSQHAFVQLRELAKELDGEYALEHFDITFDEYAGPDKVKMNVEFRGNVIWRGLVPVNGLSSDGVSMADNELRDTVSNTMKAHLNLVAQMHFARLEQMFPKSIDSVHMGYDPAKDRKMLHVKFKNGHVASGPESEAKSELFHARCAMLYDLPPI